MSDEQVALRGLLVDLARAPQAARLKAERESLSPQLNARLDELASRWQGEAGAAARRLAGLVATAHVRLGQVIAELDRAAPPGETPPRLTDSLNELDGLLRQAESAAATVPGLLLDDVPGWGALVEARRSLVAPHRRNVFLFRCAVLMAGAEGGLSTLKRSFLTALADSIHLSPAEADALIERGGRIEPSEFAGTASEARELARRLCLAAVADGLVTHAGGPAAEQVARCLGIPPGELAEVLGAKAAGVPALGDWDVVQRCIRDRGGLPERTLLPDQIAGERVARLRRRLKVPPKEDVLLVYEDSFLGSAFECAALTSSRLYVSPARAMSESAELSLIVRWRRDGPAAVLELEGGRSIRMARAAAPFLELVIACVGQGRAGASRQCASGT